MSRTVRFASHVVVAAALVAGSAGHAQAAADKIARGLLQLEDMPNGYALDSLETSGGDAGGSFCGIAPIGASQEAPIATATYNAGGALGSYVISVAAQPPKGRAKKGLDAIAKGIARGCKPTTETKDGKTTTTSYFALKAPKVCDQSVSFRLKTSGDSVPLTADVVTFRCGENFGMTMTLAIVGTAPDIVALSKKAATRLRSIS